jgi:UDP-N-acetylmuramate: L-alanyl-gamma-D-glutamyl-meso-diaminopimelate ligase
MDIKTIKSVHFIAIGGSVMHNMALALHEKGIKVSGSDDEIYEPAAGKLKNGGINAQVGWKPESINDSIDLVVLGMHAKEDNPELLKAKEQRIVVGGSHGKSTITSMIMHVLKHAGREFDYLVGAEVEGFPLTVSLSDAPVIVLEGDEYLASKLEPVAKFLKYEHHIGLISGIAWDHKNVFTTFNEYTKQFDLFADQTPKAGSLVFNEEDDLTNIVGSKEREDVRQVPYKTHEAVIKEGKTFLKTKDFGEIPVNVFGKHNLQNIAGALALLKLIGIEEKVFYDAIQSFKGAKNRLELLAENNGNIVFKDYAHSPSKVGATVDALKEQYANANLTIAYELHTFSSLNREFIKEYKGTLDKADQAFVYLNPKNLKLNDAAAFSEADIQKAFGNENIKFFEDVESLVAQVEASKTGDKNTFAFLSSGKFNQINLKELAEKLVS